MGWRYSLRWPGGQTDGWRKWTTKRKLYIFYSYRGRDSIGDEEKGGGFVGGGGNNDVSMSIDGGTKRKTAEIDGKVDLR